MSFYKTILFIILTVVFSTHIFGQGREILNPNYYAYYLPKHFIKTNRWIEADKERATTNYNGVIRPNVFLQTNKELDNHIIYKGVIVDGYNGTVPDSMKLSDFIRVIKTQKSFISFLEAKDWAVKNYSEAFPVLINLLTDTTTVGLMHTHNDLWVTGRDMKFDGHCGVIEEDIFTVAGRASYILNRLTGEYFAKVYPTITMRELINFQTLWLNWIKKLKRKI